MVVAERTPDLNTSTESGSGSDWYREQWSKAGLTCHADFEGLGSAEIAVNAAQSVAEILALDDGARSLAEDCGNSFYGLNSRQRHGLFLALEQLLDTVVSELAKTREIRSQATVQ